MSQRRSGFGSGFSKDVEAVLTSFHTGLIYADEARANLRIAGMELREQIDEPVIDFPGLEEEEQYEPEEEPVNE